MLCIEFRTKEPDILIGLLSAFPFEGFQETEEAVEAYIEEDDWVQFQSRILENIGTIATLRQQMTLPEINWNAEWEASFHPVTIDTFCAIRASFHEPMPGFEHEIVIDPKMAFGTGHHETTELMIRLMQTLPLHGSTVLDLGCGTGILAILAAKCGAARVLAVDNDPEAVMNAQENASLNKVEIHCLNDITAVRGQHFKYILANINRNVLIKILPDLAMTLSPDGSLLLSGFLTDDAQKMRDAVKGARLAVLTEKALGEWMAYICGQADQS